jgi:hypothetical protein
MFGSLPILLFAAAQSATPPADGPVAEEAVDYSVYGPGLPPKPKPKVRTAAAATPCKPTETKDVKEDTREIVVCAPKQEGYRIDPDVMKAQRIKKNNGKKRGPERLVDNSCASIGPMGCRGDHGGDDAEEGGERRKRRRDVHHRPAARRISDLPPGQARTRSEGSGRGRCRSSQGGGRKRKSYACSLTGR